MTANWIISGTWRITSDTGRRYLALRIDGEIVVHLGEQEIAAVSGGIGDAKRAVLAYERGLAGARSAA